MNSRARSALAGCLSIVAVFAAIQNASAADYPMRPIKLVIPYAAGGPTDIFGRLLAEYLARELKQAVFVENKGGAQGAIGAEMVAHAEPDGYTLLGTSGSVIILNPLLYKKLSYDPARELRMLALVTEVPVVLCVHPSVPANNLKELVALSQTTKLDFAVTAIGSAPHLAGVAVEKATNAKWQYIPYKGGSQAIGDTVGGQTQVLMNGMLATLPFVQAGKLKVIGVSKATRVPLLPDVPTIAEQGVSGFESGTWQGVLVPAGTPATIVARLSTELTRIIRSPDIRARLTAQA